MFTKKVSLQNFCKIDRKIPVSKQASKFIKKENSAQVFSCDFYEIFLEHLFYRAFPDAFSIVLLAYFLAFKFSFSNQWTDVRRRKNVKNTVLPMVQGKPLAFLIKSSPKCLEQQNQNSLPLFCNNLAISYEWLKWKGINHSYTKKLLEW